MESFVPFDGFFSATSDIKFPLSGNFQSMSRCQERNESCRKDIPATSKGNCTTSFAERYQSGLPSWLEMAAFSFDKGLDVKVCNIIFLNIYISSQIDKIASRLGWLGGEKQPLELYP